MLDSSTELFADWAPGRFYHATLPTGNGLCTICLTPSGHLLVYDCGTDGVVSPAKFVRKCIREYHVGAVHHKVDTLIISHPHVDHYKAIHEFYGARREIPVRTLRRRKKVLKEAVSETMREGRSNDRDAAKTLKSMSDEYIHPADSVDYEMSIAYFEVGTDDLHNEWPTDLQKRTNNSSTVVILTLGEHKTLLTGDLESEGWDLLLARSDFVEAAENPTTIVAPHHGHESGWNRGIVDALGKPDVWIISALRGNEHCDARYSSEDAARGIRLDGESRRTLSTKDRGTVEVLTEGDGTTKYAIPTIDISMNENQRRIAQRRAKQFGLKHRVYR